LHLEYRVLFYPKDHFSALAAGDFLAAAGLAGLDLPNEPLKILPFFVFLSPLPMMIFFSVVQK
jgi:hypothetical protein